jgi:hypothetical protein
VGLGGVGGPVGLELEIFDKENLEKTEKHQENEVNDEDLN